MMVNEVPAGHVPLHQTKPVRARNAYKKLIREFVRAHGGKSGDVKVKSSFNPIIIIALQRSNPSRSRQLRLKIRQNCLPRQRVKGRRLSPPKELHTPSQ